MKYRNAEDWEDSILALPLAGKVSGEDDEHQPGSDDFVPYVGDDWCGHHFIRRV